MVGEVKSVFGSLEELNRSLDVKVRLAPTICRKRFGWTPKHVGRLLIVPGVSSIRRVVAAHRQTMDELYPASGQGRYGRGCDVRIGTSAESGSCQIRD